jgi:hypothetical protein
MGKEVYSRAGAAARFDGPWLMAGFSRRCFRQVRYKEITKVYWQGGAETDPARYVSPVGYRTSKNGRSYYGDRLPVDERFDHASGGCCKTILIDGALRSTIGMKRFWEWGRRRCGIRTP